jgi:2-succinyl-6-hydroxy-2,4-cyclohexadiene-1-carboxylate synthase
MRLNGLDFHVEIDGTGPPLLLLHGFTGGVRAWDHLRPCLTPQATVISIDLLGHGQSAAPDDPQRYSLDWANRDLQALLDALGLEAAGVLGYSMGGRVALHFAVHVPGRVRRLILESASPGIEDAAQRQQRVVSDGALAERILGAGIPAFVADWELQPLLAAAPHVRPEERAQQHAQRLDNSPIGLANSLRGMGAGQQPPLWASLGQLRLPVSLIVGQRDTRYARIAERMLTLLPAANQSVIRDAGHTVHVDQPEDFGRAVTAAFSASVSRSAHRS